MAISFDTEASPLVANSGSSYGTCGLMFSRSIVALCDRSAPQDSHLLSRRITKGGAIIILEIPALLKKH